MQIPNQTLDPIEWTTLLFHELSHSADVRLISLWAVANQLRIARGLEPDDLFSVMSLVKNNKLYLHKGVYKLFVESRAYRISALLYEALTPQTLGDALEQVAPNAQYSIRPHLSDQELGVFHLDNVSDLFLRGLIWGEEMEDT